MAKVPNGVETLPKISIAWVGCTNVTDDRRTDEFEVLLIIHWFKSYLCNRQQYTVVNNVSSCFSCLMWSASRLYIGTAFIFAVCKWHFSYSAKWKCETFCWWLQFVYLGCGCYFIIMSNIVQWNIRGLQANREDLDCLVSFTPIHCLSSGNLLKEK